MWLRCSQVRGRAEPILRKVFCGSARLFLVFLIFACRKAFEALEQPLNNLRWVNFDE
jgi:hypothetical protein